MKALNLWLALAAPVNYSKDPEYWKLRSNFFINIVMPSSLKKGPFPLPLSIINYLILEIYNKKISFSQAKQRYKDCIELIDFIESKVNYCFYRGLYGPPNKYILRSTIKAS